MDRLAVTVAVICFLFSIAHARIPADRPGYDVIQADPSTTLPGSDDKAFIMLPSDKLESKSAAEVNLPDALTDFKHETDSNFVESVQATHENEGDAVELSRPLTYVSFRPINRHFHHMQFRGPFPFRFPRRCHHNHFNGEGPRHMRRVVPYGDDMLVAGDEMKFDPAVRGMMRQNAKRFQIHEMPEFPFKHDDVFHGDFEKMGPHHHHHQHHHEEEERGFMKGFRKPHHHRREEEEEENEEGGFMEKFRKFLNHF